MFRIGEFAQIAQVSGRLLRYYDELGLLSPRRIDAVTGYRWYSAGQLPRLNRILALKDLGLTLEQIRPLIDGEIGADDMRALLTERRAAVSIQLQEQEMRLRRIESRIAQLDGDRPSGDEDVVMKSIDEVPFLSTGCLCEDLDHALRVVGQVAREASRKISAGARDRLMVVSRERPQDQQLDLDVGFSLTREARREIQLDGGVTLRPGTLPAAERVATVVRSGPAWEAHLAFGVLGGWIEDNGYELDGPCREVFLASPFDGAPEPVIEIQFPVRPAA